MADALVSVVLELGSTILLDGVKQEVKLVAGVKKEIETLTKTLTIIQGVLEDAEHKQVNDKVVKLWLEEFKDISYNAEDILDEWMTRSRISQMEESNPAIKKKVQSILLNLLSCSCFKLVIIRHKIGIKIKELNKRLVEVNENIQTYGLREIRSNEQQRPITSDLVVVEEIYGRNVDKEMILTKLLDESAHHDSHVPVISIVGTGGFGKTTLAQLILKEMKQLSKFKFDKHMWVCVSNPFDREKVAKEIIEQARGKVPDTVGWATLQKSLCESVCEKRFILVLDDVWPHNDNDWRQLKQALDSGVKGSRILITTRDESVANMMNSSYTHLLRQMSNDDCWSLFKRIAFSRRKDDLDNFEDIGKAISDKCNGVPLAVRVIASLVCNKKTRQDWRAVLESNIWEVQQGGEGFLPSILFSYYALPSHLKPCLLYCAVFPKDSEMKKEEMVKLWMAQGYLGSGDDGSADLEMIGRNYFDDLAKLSFFQDFKKDGQGKITSCKMHDLVQDFVHFLTKNETKIILEEEKVSSVKVRHLCAGDLDWSSIYQQKNLRTLRISRWKRNSTLAQELLHQLTSLRALSLRGCGIKVVPSEVEKLLHLRYLDLSWNDKLKELPETICNLVNLQTLNLSYCERFIRLPKAIEKLSSSLRHLHIEGYNNLKYMPVGVGKLRWLRTLDKFIVGGCDEESKEKGCTIKELSLLNHIEGDLKIIGLDASNAAQADLKMKKKLRSLEMIFSWEEEVVVGMEDLEPHPDLEKLKLKNYKGSRLPNWISSLSNLTELTLEDLPKLQLPALGKLKFLEVLRLYGLDSVKRLGSEFYGLDNTCNRQVIFPKLKVLELKNMVDFFPCLIRLGIEWCPRLSRLQPSLPPLLKKLTLGFDVGVLNTSLLPLLLNNNNYPNLNYFEISYSSSQSSLPQGFNQLTSIRQLKFFYCNILDFGPDDLKHLTMLEELEIWECSILAERFRGEISSSSSHGYSISINGSKLDPINVHSCISCDNCEMDPIVGKRYKCKDCYDGIRCIRGVGFDLCEECYNTPSRHTDRVNQHHKKGHTFDLISNRGDRPVPVHPDDASEDAEGGLVVARSAEIEEQIELAQDCSDYKVTNKEDITPVILLLLSASRTLGVDQNKSSFHNFLLLGILTEYNETCRAYSARWKLKVGNVTNARTSMVDFFPCLIRLGIEWCPRLSRLQPSLPPLLKKLTLGFDVGVLNTSLLPLLLNNNKYPNLKYFEISYSSSQSSLPQGFNQLTSIRQLKFFYCNILDFGPDDLKHLTMLEELEIWECSILAERFRGGGGEISSSSSHGYSISINGYKQDPINVHSGIRCDNCKMDPIVGKRYKCKDCLHHSERSVGFDLCEECYNTPSKHTDRVNQHHIKGHTFELIANRGDRPVPVHPDDASEDAKGGLVVAKSAEIEEQIESAQV